jgi:hypothetical protein
MKFLKSLFRKEADKQQPPTWDIKTPAERIEPRVRDTEVKLPPAPGQKKKDPNPFLDDPMLDTISLEMEATVVEENPYQTSSWKLDPDNDTRKLKTITMGEQTDKPTKNPFNPYDTGKMRRGWKK